MKKDGNFLEKIKDGFDKLVDKLAAPESRPKVDPNYKIKYDGTEEELLGLVDEAGVVIDREGLQRYLKMVEYKRTIRRMPQFESLKEQGIIDEDANVLDEERFKPIFWSYLSRYTPESFIE